MKRNRLPAARPDAAMAKHLEILDRLAGRLVARLGRKAVGQAGAMDRLLRHAVDRVGRRHTDDLEQGRRDVGDMMKLGPHATAIGDAGRPMHHQRIAHTAAMGVLLVALARRVAGLRPAPGIVAVRIRAADVIKAGHRLLDGGRDAVVVAHRVDHAHRAAFLAGTVVRHHQEHGVVELTDGLQERRHPADVVIGVIEKSGESLLQAKRQRLLGRTQLGPGLDARISRREFGVGRHDAHLLLARKPLLANRIPASIEAAAVLGDVLGRRLVRRVGRTECEIEKKRFFRDQRFLVAHETDCMIDQVFGEVIAVFGALRLIDRMVVVVELGHELVGLALLKAIEAIEAATERPLIVGPGRRGLFHRRQMPFADRKRGIAGRAQHLGKRGSAARDRAGAVGIAGVPVRQATHADRMVIAPGEQGRARRRAQRGGVKIRIAQSAGGELVDIRCIDGRSIAAEVRKAGVVEEHHDHIGCALARHRHFGPEGFGVGDRTADLAFECAAHGDVSTL